MLNIFDKVCFGSLSMDNMDVQDRCQLFDHLKWNWKRSDTISDKRIEDMEIIESRRPDRLYEVTWKTWLLWGLGAFGVFLVLFFCVGFCVCFFELHCCCVFFFAMKC